MELGWVRPECLLNREAGSRQWRSPGRRTWFAVVCVSAMVLAAEDKYGPKTMELHRRPHHDDAAAVLPHRQKRPSSTTTTIFFTLFSVTYYLKTVGATRSTPPPLSTSSTSPSGSFTPELHLRRHRHCRIPLHFNCSKDVTLMEEQFLIMKPNEITTRSFKIYPNTDQASKYFCAAKLKDSDYSEVDRAECQFTTTATVLDNGTQGMPFQPPETSINGFFDSIESIWNKLWTSIIEFITGKTCRQKCSGFFDFKCHIQYVCLSWLMMFGLFLAIFPTVLVLLWPLHQKGLFDPLYDWWEDLFGADEQIIMDKRTFKIDKGNHHTHHNKHHKQELRLPKHGAQYRRRISYEHKHKHSERDSDYLHHILKEMHKHGHKKNIDIVQHIGDNPAHHKRRKERGTSKGIVKMMELKHEKERQEKYDKHHEVLLYEPGK